jgi:hypothetical protein
MSATKPAWRCTDLPRWVFPSHGWVAEWLKAPVLTKSATADLGREAAGQAGERSEQSEDGKHALSMFAAKLAWRCTAARGSVCLILRDGWPSGLRLQS